MLFDTADDTMVSIESPHPIAGFLLFDYYIIKMEPPVLWRFLSIKIPAVFG